MLSLRKRRNGMTGQEWSETGGETARGEQETKKEGKRKEDEGIEGRGD